MSQEPYSVPLTTLRQEFRRLNDSIYLDNAGTALHSESQVRAFAEALNSEVFGNPHSQNTSSRRTTDVINDLRNRILKFFNTDGRSYQVVFTSGTTGSLKLIGENLDWTGSKFVYSMLNHNSVVGLREYAFIIRCLHYQQVEKILEEDIKPTEDVDSDDNQVLFAFPGQCNFSGLQIPLSFGDKVKASREFKAMTGISDNTRILVLCDVASLVSTHPLNLSQVRPDFLTLSFYKIFGFPTGLGALLVKKESINFLKKSYFGGGTVDAVLATENFRQFRDDFAARFEDGTTNFTNILGLKFGFDQISRLGGMTQIAQHTRGLYVYLSDLLKSLKHSNKTSACVIYRYTPKTLKNSELFNQGPILAFNVIDRSGKFVGYSEVEKLASLHDIQLRTGCFCNPGACQEFLGLSSEEIKKNFNAGHICWDDNDVINNKPTGAIRVSIPYFANRDDIQKFYDFIKTTFVDYEQQRDEVKLRYEALMSSGLGELALERLVIYPIKSCDGFEITEGGWPIGPHGLLYDREWALVDASKERRPYVNQKVFPVLSRLIGDILLVVGDGFDRELKIDLKFYPDAELSCRVCGDERRTIGLAYGGEVADWFTEFVGHPLDLVRQAPEGEANRAVKFVRGADATSNPTQAATMQMSGALSILNYLPISVWYFTQQTQPTTPTTTQGPTIAFSNESQFLLVSRSSLDELTSRLPAVESQKMCTYQNFRPNLLVSSTTQKSNKLAFEEDKWYKVKIGDQVFISSGPCNRMICVDKESLSLGVEPLKTLSTFRRTQSNKIFFGMLFVHSPELSKAPYVLEVKRKIEVLEYKDENLFNK